MTTNAERLLAWLRRWPGRHTIEEVKRATRMTKSAVRRALAELEEENAITLTSEEE